MARQKGIFKIEGKIGDVSFYKTQDGYLAREKGGVDGERIKNDPAFARTRENGAEFGSAASAGKLLRVALRPLLLNTADNRLVSRLTKVMTEIKGHDSTSARGERTIGTAIGQASAKAALKGFNFNIRATLAGVLFKPYTVTTTNGMITIPGLVPINDIVYPAGATHATFKSAWAAIDFEAGTHAVVFSPEVNLPIGSAPAAVILNPGTSPTSGANNTDIFVLAVEFFQEVNGTQYSLKNGAYNALAIVEVV
jgi:hypothetical protein